MLIHPLSAARYRVDSKFIIAIDIQIFKSFLPEERHEVCKTIFCRISSNHSRTLYLPDIGKTAWLTNIFHIISRKIYGRKESGICGPRCREFASSRTRMENPQESIPWGFFMERRNPPDKKDIFPHEHRQA